MRPVAVDRRFAELASAIHHGATNWLVASRAHAGLADGRSQAFAEHAGGVRAV
jgi:hypothetical protein